MCFLQWAWLFSNDRVFFICCCYSLTEYFQLHDVTQPRITGQKCGTKAVLTLLSYFIVYTYDTQSMFLSLYNVKK